MFGTKGRRSDKMGNSESNGKKTQKSDILPLSETALSELPISSSGSSMECVSVDAVPVSNTDSGSSCSGCIPEQPSDTSSKLEIAKYVNKKVDKTFEPFKRDISESNEDLKKKIVHYENFMSFELSFGYHDAMILYHDKDEEDVKNFCASIEKKVTLNDKQKPRIALFSRIANAFGSLFKALEFGVKRCTFVMLYITSNFVNDAWSEISSETCLMEAIHNPDKRWCVVPVFTDDKSSKSYRVPMSINTLKGVRYSIEEDFYLVSIQTLFNDRISVRKLHEKQHLQEQIKWVMEFEAKAREEALEELKMENEAKRKHEAFLKLLEQHKDQSSSTNFNKENLVNEFIDNCKPNELSVATKNEQVQHQSENASMSLPINRADGTSVDPEDIVSDTPSPVMSAPFLGRQTLEQCSLAASSSGSRPQTRHVTASGPPLGSNVAGCPQRSFDNQTSCPVATSEGIGSKNKSPNSLPQSALHPSASSESSGRRTKSNSQLSRSVGKEKAYVGISASSIDHPLSEKSDSIAEIHHHHYYYKPPTYNIKAQNVQVGTNNKLYNNSQNYDSDNDEEEQTNCETFEKEKDYSSSGSSDEFDNIEKTDEPNTFSNTNVSTPSQDGALSTGTQNTDTEKTLLQEYGINRSKPESTMGNNDPDQTRPKGIENATSDNSNNEDIDQTYVKEP